MSNVSPSGSDHLKRRKAPYVFPSQGGATFDAVDIPDSMVPGGHLTFIRLAFNDIDTNKDRYSVSGGLHMIHKSSILTHRQTDTHDHAAH